MSDQIAAGAAPVEAADPFKGGEPTFVEYSKYRETGELPERFAASVPVTEPKVEKIEEKKSEAPAAKAETVEGKEPSETEQEKKERERDGKGRFAQKVEFTPEQQAILNREVKREKEKARREAEARYAAQTSATQATVAEKKPDTAAEPQRPEPPKLSTYKGTVEEYEKELADYPAKLQAFLDSQNQFRERTKAIEKRIETSEANAIKAHPDFKDEVQSLFDDIKNHEEPVLPPHVLKTISEEAEDPLGLTYHLAKNREEFRRLAALSPSETLREVLKLDFKLAAAKSLPAPAKTEPVAKPKPPEPVGARATSSAFDVTDENTDGEEWARQRNKQVAERRRR